MDIPLTTIIAIVGTVVTALVGAIKLLFSLLAKQGERQFDLSTQIGELRGEQRGIKQLSADVLQQIEDSTRKSCESCKRVEAKIESR